MAKKLKIWYDKEADFFEVIFSDASGYMRESDDNSLMERIDENGKIIGYCFLGVSKIKFNNPIYRELELA